MRILVDDPQRADVLALLERHLQRSHAVTPAGHVHALDVKGRLDPSITFFSARREGELLGVGALKTLDEAHAELKSMHVDEVHRGQGIGRALVEHLLAFAVERGHARVSLETGTMEAFASARALYAKAGFTPCAPFGAYTSNPYSVCMTMSLYTTRSQI